MNWLDGLVDEAAEKNYAATIESTSEAPKPSAGENFGGALYDQSKAGLIELGYTVEKFGTAASHKELQFSLEEQQQRLKEREQNFVSRIKPLEVDPQVTGKAGQIFAPLAKVIPRTALGAVAGGPLLGAVFAGLPEYDSSLALSTDIDKSTAKRQALINASVLAVGSMLPAAKYIKNVAGDFAISVGAGVGLSVGGRAANRELLSSNGYEAQAQQYDPFGTTELLTDLGMSIGFFGIARGLGGRDLVDAALVQNKADDASFKTAPGVPVDPKSSQLHQNALMRSIDQMARNEPVDVSKEIAGATFIREPLGVRNNNPGNIEERGIPWKGVLPSNGDRFANFDTPQSGIRAISKNLMTYQDKYGLNTVEGIIKRWSETDQEPYINNVSKALGVSRETPINLHNPATLKTITAAIIRQENGKQPYSDAVLDESIGMALGGIPYETAGNSVRNKLAERKDLPEQFVEDLAQKYEAHAALKQKFDDDINAIMAEAGITNKPKIPDEMKGADRAVEKIVTSYGGDVNGIKDLSRATIIIDNLDQAQAAIKAAENRYGNLIELRNHLTPDSPPVSTVGYRDIKMNVDIGNGNIAELMINFDSMLKAKDEAHLIYETTRGLDEELIATGRTPTKQEAAKLKASDDAQSKIYEEAFKDTANSLKARSDIDDPLRLDSPIPNGRDTSPTQALQTYPGVKDTGTPSTFKNSVPLGNTGNSIVVTPFADIIPKNLIGRKSVSYSERGDAVQTQFAVVEDSTLITSHDNNLAENPAFPAELQPRDRTRDASELQISRIANNINPELLAESPKIADGAPIVGTDGIVESGNARTIALRRAYIGGKAENYREWLQANAKRFGIDETALAKLKNPVLVRIREASTDRAEFTRLANEAGVASMSVVEVAKADAARLNSLDGMVAAEDGTINFRASNIFVRNFMRDTVAPTEQGAMIGPDGILSQQGEARIKNAVFAKAYGDSELVGKMAESTDSNIKNIMNGMLRAAPAVARLREMISDGGRYPMDIAPLLNQAVREFSDMRSKGYSVEQYLAQQDMFDFKMTPELNNLLVGLEENARAPKRIADMINGFVKSVDDLGDPRQASLLDDAPPLTQDLIADSIDTQRNNNAVQTSKDLFGSPEMQSAVAVAELNPTMRYTMDDGREVSVAEAIKIADDAVAAAEVEAKAFNAAVICFNRTG